MRVLPLPPPPPPLELNLTRYRRFTKHTPKPRRRRGSRSVCSLPPLDPSLRASSGLSLAVDASEALPVANVEAEETLPPEEPSECTSIIALDLFNLYLQIFDKSTCFLLQLFFNAF